MEILLPSVLLNGSIALSLINFRGPLIAELIDRGYQVHVTAPEIDHETRIKLAERGAIVHEVSLGRTGLDPIQDLGYLRQLIALMRRIKPQHVIGYTIKPNIWGSLAARIVGCPSTSMVTGLGLSFIEGAGLKRRAIQRLARALYRLATACNKFVVFQNPDDQRDFIAAGCLGDPRKARQVNGSGVDIAYFAPTPLPPEPSFLLIARLLKTKGIEEYVAAAQQLIGQGISARFGIAGFFDPGPDAIEESAAHAWRAAGIEYLGPLNDVRPALAAASVYVLPSYREGTPRTVLEAMAMGRPIVTTDVPGCRQTIEHGVSGLLVPARDSAALAAAMRQLAEAMDLRAAMGQAARARAERLYAADSVAKALLDGIGLVDIRQSARPAGTGATT